MVVRREQGAVTFSFSLLERKILERALTMLLENYQVNPAEIDERAAAVWYSSAGCRSAGMSAEETADWMKQLHALRFGRIAALRECLEQLGAGPEAASGMRVRAEQADALMTALNDHRLLLAAHHNIGEAEMSARSWAALANLPARQQTTLLEIEFFAYLIDELHHLLSEPGSLEGED
jgi:hypothetical protein